MNNYYHYSNLKQRISLDLMQIKNYKFLFFILLLSLLYYLNSIFFSILLYLSLYIYCFDYILLIADVLFLDLLFNKFIYFQKVYKNVRKYFYLYFYKYVVIDFLNILKKKVKLYIKNLKGYWSSGRSKYNMSTLFSFFYDLMRKLFFKFYYGFKRLRRRDQDSAFWKYIYMYYYRQNNVNIFFSLIYSFFFDFFSLIYKLNISILYNFFIIYIKLIINYIYFVICNILCDIKIIIRDILCRIYYLLYLLYINFKFYLCYKWIIINYNKIYGYFYICRSIINIILFKAFISQLIIVISLIINKYIYNYNNDYTIIFIKLEFLKVYFFDKFSFMFKGFYFIKNEKSLLNMLKKFLHIRILNRLMISFFIELKEMPFYDYIKRYY